MAITNWTGISPRNTRHRHLDEFFSPHYRQLVGKNRIDDDVMTVPPANIANTDRKYDLHLAVPGMKKDDFQVNVSNGILNISAERKIENENQNDGYSFREFSYHNFERCFSLPEAIDEDNIKATYQDGILKFEIPRKANPTQEDTRRSIAVK